MEVKTLYKYTRENGGTTVSPVKPECDYTELVRLIADVDKLLTKDGIDMYPCTDVESAEGWYEVDAPKTEELE